jgi:molybdenum cofactor cytidylyltransferase
MLNGIINIKLKGTKAMKIGCVLLAAGAASRFGGGKLCALLGGKPIIEYTLENLRDVPFARRAIVAATPELLALAQRYGIGGTVNDRPDLGVSRSIRMGLELMDGTDACMFCVADQPLLRRETLDGMLQTYERGTILMVAHNGQSGNPVIYPASLYSELSSLVGEESGKTVACRHEGLLRVFHIPDSLQLSDIDTREDLMAAEELLHDSAHSP